MTEFKDYYKRLGLAKNAAAADIKDSYKKLVKKHHPDTNGGDDKLFKEIQEAYEVLKDNNKKARYDALYRQNQGFKNTFSSNSQAFKQQKMYSGFKSFSDFDKRATEKAEEGFAEHKKFTKKATPGNRKRNEDENGKFSDFFEMLFGQQKEELKKSNESKRGDDYEMPIELSLEDTFHGSIRKIEISSSTQGTRRLEVSIPAGVIEGNKIKIANEGKPGSNGGANGDLYLIVKIKDHNDFQIEGDDVYSELELRAFEAVLGATKQINTIQGTVELVIPAQTQNNKSLRLRSKGLKRKDGSYGDHFARISIVIPDSPSKEEVALYKELEKLANQ